MLRKRESERRHGEPECVNGEEFARDFFSEFINDFSLDEDGFVEFLVHKEHRSLQQNAFRLFLKCIDEWARVPEQETDLRNDDTIRLCKKITEALGDDRYLSVF